MTPFAARDPYSDAPAAPFTTSTLSMSSELRSADELDVRQNHAVDDDERRVALVDARRRAQLNADAVARLRRPDRSRRRRFFPECAAIAFVGGTGMSSFVTRPTVNGTLVPAVGSTTPVITVS